MIIPLSKGLHEDWEEVKYVSEMMPYVEQMLTWQVLGGGGRGGLPTVGLLAAAGGHTDKARDGKREEEEESREKEL